MILVELPPVRQAFDIRPLGPALGAEVVGLDLNLPLVDDDFARLHRAHLDHHVLVFRDQRITPAQQVEFSARWGPLQRHVLHQFALAGHPDVLIVSNIVENGQPVGLGDAGVFWHSDLSYKENPSLGSFLHAQELPAEGGDTLFANQHAAWDELPAELARAVQGRHAEHSYLKVYAELQRRSPWRPDLSPAQVAAVPTVSHPIVRTHPETKRKALFVSEHFTTRVVGLPDGESEALLKALYDHSTQERYVYRHHWLPGDMVFWDNRSVLHLAAGCPPEQRRRLNRVTIEGDVPF
ncbi:TauD/TfdA dioxygenase family protein [Hydrogenophaga sp.]|uniref:TauD/TfdA dioxygenase family protein n=1 Tax=Hydrogenophaga sp. TaxID=1904254 RepID=UPI003F71A422